MKIKNCNIFGEDNQFHIGSLDTDGAFIALESHDGIEIDGEGLYAIPGLIDIHIHGSYGHDFCEGTDKALDVMSDYLGKNGITAFTATSMTLPEETLLKIYENAANYQQKKGALFVGINMEGPFLAPAKKGAQNGGYLKNPDEIMFRKLNNASGNKIKLVSVAPELPGAMEFIEKCSKDVVIALAHTAADYETAAKALDLGACHITHLYNAMLPFSHRAPGVPGAAMDKEGCTVELISDGIHVDPCVVRATYKLFTDNRVVLISDNMMAVGMADGQYELGGQPVKVLGCRATLSDGTIAGSATNLMDCMRKAVSFGIPLEQAVKTASVNPAKVIGEFGNMGSLSIGKLANIVLLDKDLVIQRVIIKGKEEY